MARVPKTSRTTHRIDLCAAARLGPIMRRRREAGLSVVAPGVAKNVLWSLVNFGGQDGRAWPSRKTLADEAETSVSTVRRVLEIFASEGLITETIERSRGAAAGRKTVQADGESGATNIYVLDYHVLGQWAEDEIENAAQGEPRTRPMVDRVVEERGSAESRTRFSGEQNAVQIGGRSKEEPYGTVFEPPPTPPGGEPEVGGQSAARHDGQTLLAGQAREILAAYPRTSSDLPDDDARAAVDAILREADTPERCAWVEIRSAALAVRAMKPKDPLWARTWFRRRGYLPLVLEARGRADVAAAQPQATSAAEELARTGAEIDAALAGLDADQLRELHQRVLGTLASDLERSHLAKCNPTRSRMLRGLMAQLVRREAA